MAGPLSLVISQDHRSHGPLVSSSGRPFPSSPGLEKYLPTPGSGAATLPRWRCGSERRDKVSQTAGEVPGGTLLAGVIRPPHPLGAESPEEAQVSFGFEWISTLDNLFINSPPTATGVEPEQVCEGVRTASASPQRSGAIGKHGLDRKRVSWNFSGGRAGDLSARAMWWRAACLAAPTGGYVEPQKDARRATLFHLDGRERRVQ